MTWSLLRRFSSPSTSMTNVEASASASTTTKGSNGLALRLVLPIVVGRVYLVADLDVRIAGCDPVVEITFVTLLRLT